MILNGIKFGLQMLPGEKYIYKGSPDKKKKL